jgi:diguanylate cyclase (GGDEF)-like protein/PAS domain S-box-containing protein
MSLRKKVIFGITVSVLLLIAMLSFFLHWHLTEKFLEIEDQDIHANIERAMKVLEYEVAVLNEIVEDWAVWDDTYEYIVQKNLQYQKSNLPDQTYRQIEINYMLFLDANRNIVYERAFDFLRNTPLEIPGSLHSLLINDTLQKRLMRPEDRVKGLLRVGDQIMIVAACPILTSNAKALVRGYLVFGRYLDERKIQQLSALVKFPLRFILLNPGPVAKKPGTDKVFLTPDIWTNPINNKTIYGNATINDIYYQNIAFLSLSMPRSIYYQGMLSIRFIALAMAVVSILFGAIMLTFIENNVIRHLTLLNRKVRQITAVHDLSVRLPVFGNNELTQYSKVFNRMMNNLENYAQKLEEEQEALTRSNRTLQNIIEFLPDTIFVIDEQGKVTTWNRAIERMTGFSKEAVMEGDEFSYSIPFYGQTHPMLVDMLDCEIEEVQKIFPTAEKSESTIQAEIFIPNFRNPQGSYFLATATPLFDKKGNWIGSIETQLDITELKENEKQLQYMGHHDSLTGLHNRTYFETEMNNYEAGTYQQIGLIVCDVDGLKVTNDTKGHSWGDRLIVNSAKLLHAAVTPPGFAARVGGDEFAIFLPDCQNQLPQQICNRIQELINQANLLDPENRLSISLGWAIGSHPQPGREIFETADNNMYHQKKLHNSVSPHNFLQVLGKIMGNRNHTYIIQRYVEALAGAVGMSEPQIRHLKLLIEFHDIGMIEIPDAILLKKSSLTPEELREMQRHTEIGYSIVRSAQELSCISDWILKHHEWWDGHGYPLGLKGKKIPLECRILAIAGAFVGMISDRPYRKALTVKQALAEIARCSGTQFDPNLAKIFLETVTPQNEAFSLYFKE